MVYTTSSSLLDITRVNFLQIFLAKGKCLGKPELLQKRSVSAAQVKGAAVLGALGLVCYKWPLVMAVFCTALLVLGLAVLLAFAAAVAGGMRFAAYLNDASCSTNSDVEP